MYKKTTRFLRNFYQFLAHFCHFFAHSFPQEVIFSSQNAVTIANKFQLADPHVLPIPVKQAAKR